MWVLSITIVRSRHGAHQNMIRIEALNDAGGGGCSQMARVKPEAIPVFPAISGSIARNSPFVQVQKFCTATVTVA